jgi:hypothetical protein
MTDPETPESLSGNSHDRLDGWKEIADYLGKAVRTAQRWERELGMPVHRLMGTGREIIFAFRSEIDRWLLSDEQAHNSQTEGYSPDPPDPQQQDLEPGAATTAPGAPSEKLRWYRKSGLVSSWAWISTTALVVGIFVVLWNYSTANAVGPPEQAHVDSRRLVVLDGRGRQVWEKMFEAPFLMSRYTPEALLFAQPPIWIGDLDGDSRREAVILYDPVTRVRSGCLLLCYSDQGEEKWRFNPGKTVRDAVKNYDPPFTIQNFIVSDLSGSGKRSVLITSHHFSDYPNRFVMLDEHGKQVSDYWHSGFLELIDTMDLDKDGVQEILLAGVNNGYGAAVLVVLDPRDFRGASRQPLGDPYQLQDFESGRETAMLLFPRSCINQRSKQFNQAVMLVASGETIRVEVGESEDDAAVRVTFLLNRNLKVIDVSVTDRFKDVHRQLWLDGKLDHEYSPAELGEVRVLRNGAR